MIDQHQQSHEFGLVPYLLSQHKITGNTSSQRERNSVSDRTITCIISKVVLLIPEPLHYFSAEWDMFHSLLPCRTKHRNKQIKNITVHWSMNVCQLTCHCQKIVWISSKRHRFLKVHSNDDFVKERPCPGEFLLVGTTKLNLIVRPYTN